ncbi:MAG: division/cell wall cluster transcriptional repressor MraZ [Candidatus Daviesbacteria bacterium]|nr:division/cell wall cluster transcriptional repressor MraZ [Candidatus Daviesbacteria bacterium]
MFLGEYQTKFSGQGRIVLPKKFRKELINGKEIVLSRGFDGCIWGYSVTGFTKEAERQLAISPTEEGARHLRRYLFSGAEETILDEQGRFIIPKQLIDYANITDEVVLIGTGDHFEIWNPKKWNELINKILKKGKQDDNN